MNGVSEAWNRLRSSVVRGAVTHPIKKTGETLMDDGDRLCACSHKPPVYAEWVLNYIFLRLKGKRRIHVVR